MVAPASYPVKVYKGERGQNQSYNLRNYDLNLFLVVLQYDFFKMEKGLNPLTFMNVSEEVTKKTQTHNKKFLKNSFISLLICKYHRSE